MSEHLLEWLREGLIRPNKSRRGLAKAIGIDPASVTRMLQGRRRFRVEEIAPAARYLDIAPPKGFTQRRQVDGVPYIDLPVDLRKLAIERSMDMNIEPEEFLARALRAALLVLGPRRDRGLEG
jgi:hypothetical protein